VNLMLDRLKINEENSEVFLINSSTDCVSPITARLSRCRQSRLQFITKMEAVTFMIFQLISWKFKDLRLNYILWSIKRNCCTYNRSMMTKMRFFS